MEQVVGATPKRAVYGWIIAISIVISAALIWLDYFRGRGIEPAWVASLPGFNASMNALSAVCLMLGYYNIRRGRRDTHMKFMLGALTFSAFFLLSYVTYHFFHGDTKFPGQGWVRPVYFFILISHIGLSMIALPLILTTLWFVYRGQFGSHKKIARWTFPVWLYISVTGVVVYFFLNSFIA